MVRVDAGRLFQYEDNKLNSW